MTANIGNSMTYSPSSTIHSYQGITFENETLFIDLSYIWDVKMIYPNPPTLIYVAVSRRKTGRRYVADLAVFTDGKLVNLIEVVVASPPSDKKLAYYPELGIECSVVTIVRNAAPNVPPNKYIQANAKGCARRFENSDLSDCYNFDDSKWVDKHTAQGYLIDSDNDNALQVSYYRATLSSVKLLSEEDDEILEVFPTPDVLKMAEKTFDLE
ncbi:hypothetical protein T492DRAFT_831852 [Pavlovales sp. CCMP2436]|nr:hypothetical protein T492DRAFT_831852 [Pavlovales sp. CCMP2436]